MFEVIKGVLLATYMSVAGFFGFAPSATDIKSEITTQSERNGKSETDIFNKDVKESVCKKSYVSCVAGETWVQGDAFDTTIPLSGGYKAFVSPDARSAVIVEDERVGILLQLDSLEADIIATTTPDKAFGVLTGFPSFVPQVKWQDKDIVKFLVYKKTHSLTKYKKMATRQKDFLNQLK